MSGSFLPFAEFAASFDQASGALPSWVHGGGGAVLEPPALRHRVEEVLDTVVALERAEWMQDGVHAGPTTLPETWRAVQHAARTLRVAVPPVVVGGISPRAQGTFGTDDRAFLYLSTFLMDAASEGERRFFAGRLVGRIAARHVTAGTLYALLVDQAGLRSAARKAVGPALEVLLAPMSLGLRLVLSRWHRASEISADRAGLVCCGDLADAGRALLRVSLGRTPEVSVEEYLSHLRDHGSSPGRWTELLADQPFTHKRLRALALYARSEDFAANGGRADGPLLSRPELDRRTDELLGVG
jgi:Zn-dependent protease with chaperone function